MRTLPGVAVRDRAVSGTVAPRWRGALAYLALLARSLAPAARLRRRQPAVQRRSGRSSSRSSGRCAESSSSRSTTRCRTALPARRHAPTAWLAAMARKLVFVSALQPRRLHRPLRRAIPRPIRGRWFIGAAPVQPGLRAGALRSRGAARSAGLLEHRQAVQGRRAVRRAGAVGADQGRRPSPRGPRRAGMPSCGRCATSWPRSASSSTIATSIRQSCSPCSRATSSSSCPTARRRSRARSTRCCTTAGSSSAPTVGDLGDFMRRFGLEAMLLKRAQRRCRRRRARAAEPRPAGDRRRIPGRAGRVHLARPRPPRSAASTPRREGGDATIARPFSQHGAATSGAAPGAADVHEATDQERPGARRPRADERRRPAPERARRPRCRPTASSSLASSRSR